MATNCKPIRPKTNNQTEAGHLPPRPSKALIFQLLLVTAILAIVIHCCLNATLSAATREDIKTLLSQKQAPLLSLATQAQGKVLTYQHTEHSQWERMDWRSRLTFFGTGLLWVDGTDHDGMTEFTFQSVYLEGGLSLYHSPSGEEAVLAQFPLSTCVSFDTIPEGGICQEGLGIDKTGFVYCEQLQPGWYLVEWNLPT